MYEDDHTNTKARLYYEHMSTLFVMRICVNEDVEKAIMNGAFHVWL